MRPSLDWRSQYNARQETKHKTSVWCYQCYHHHHITRWVTDLQIDPYLQHNNTVFLSAMSSCLSISVCHDKLSFYVSICHPPSARCRSSSQTSSRSPGHQMGTRWCRSDTWTWRSLFKPCRGGHFYALFKAFRLNVIFSMLTRGYVGADPAAGDYHICRVGACVDIIDMCRYV